MSTIKVVACICQPMMRVSASIHNGVFLRMNQAADPSLFKMTEELLARDPESAKRCAEDHVPVTA